MDPLRRVPWNAKIALARQMRRQPTPAERHAWHLLRNRGILGLKFRRQHIVSGFILDFYCVAERIALELDGRLHEGAAQAAYDRARSEWLRAGGIRVVRLHNRDLSKDRLEALLRPLVVK